MRIGIADVSGWIQTPAIAISESGMAIRFCARAEEMNSKSMAIAVELVSGNEVSISYAVELTTEMKEFVIPANAWQHGNCVRFNSLASGNRKVVIGAVAVLSGYSEGTATPDMLKVVPTGVTTSCTVGGLPDSAVVYAGVRTMGAEGMSSDISEGVKVDLSKVDTLNAIRMSTLADNTYSQDFDSLAGLTMSSHDTEFFNGVTVPFMQAWQDGIAASSIVHYSGGNQSGAKFLALSTNVSSSARAFGARGKQGTMMVWGIAFTNDTDVAVALTGVSYSAQQWGFANTTNQTLDFSCLVTNRLDWIVGNTCGWRSCIETEAKVFADAHDMPESTIVDYVPSDGMRIAPGEVVYLRWTLYPPVKGQSSTMAIDDLTVTFESAVQQMFIRIVQNAKMP